jgi:hypothetical protein
MLSIGNAAFAKFRELAQERGMSVEHFIESLVSHQALTRNGFDMNSGDAGKDIRPASSTGAPRRSHRKASPRRGSSK